MDYHCEVVGQPVRQTATIRTRVPVQDLPKALGKAYGAVMQYLGEARPVQPVCAPFVTYDNMDMNDLDIEAGFCVPQAVTDRGEIRGGEIPAGKEAACLYVGPYQDCGPAYDALNRWMQEQGLQPSGVVTEWYLNDPAVTPPQELQTRIAFALR